MKKQIVLLVLVFYIFCPLVDSFVQNIWLRMGFKLLLSLPIYILVFNLISLSLSNSYNLEIERKIAESWKSGYDNLEKRYHKLLTYHLSKQISMRLNGTLATNHIIKIQDGKLTCKIGNEDVLVDVDIEEAEKGSLAQSIENAYDKFLSKLS